MLLLMKVFFDTAGGSGALETGDFFHYRLQVETATSPNSNECKPLQEVAGFIWRRDNNKS